ncbi:uncharacterized protein [Triticum aestivum]|uniref:Cyclin dependent protein kinase n=1 Tax=Triticum aestivum TaxID=4565 RepID=Q2L390_WHEAT|nr:uncharacterized protein LOC123116351 [Triticum aestivum]CAJ75600.1 cyclin dependent protein kinase [Triticum aestivum]
MAIKRVFPGDHPDFKVDTSCGAPRFTFCNRARYCSSTDYQETRALGVGAYGGVVEARHLTNGWTVAVKKPLPCAHEGAGIACGCADARTLREAAFLAACHRHRAIVELRALSLDRCAGKLSVVMECVGPSLHEVLHESGWTRSGPVRSRSGPSFGPAAGGPGRTGPSCITVLILGTGPAMKKPGPDRADRPTATGGDLPGCGGELCDVRGCSGEVGHMRDSRPQGVCWAARLLFMNREL